MTSGAMDRAMWRVPRSWGASRAPWLPAMVATAGIALVVSGCASTAATGSAGPAPAVGPSAAMEESGPAATPAAPLDSTGEGMITLGLTEPYQPRSEGTATDDYRCFLVDLGLDEDRFITGVRFAPGNPAMVHHAIVYRVEPEQAAAARERDARDEGQGWTCFGGPDLPPAPTPARDLGDDDRVQSLAGSGWLAAWAPGGRESRYPDGTGVFVRAGSLAVVQVHYNLLGGSGKDSTQVHLRTRSGTEELTALETYLLPAPVELPCRPGESGPLCDREASVADTVERFGGEALRTIFGLQFICGGELVEPVASATQSCVHEVGRPMVIHAAAGHMHLLGRTITIDVNPEGSDAQRILDIPMWDFDNQARSWLPEPIRVAEGDRLRVTCTHDTSLRDRLPALQDLPPRYITWGEGTSDEMCLGLLTVSKG